MRTSPERQSSTRDKPLTNGKRLTAEEVRAALTEDHSALARGLDRLVSFVKAADETPARDEWMAFEPGVLRHLDAEEMFLLPAYERTDAVEAHGLRDEHAKIRLMLGQIGLAFDLHLVRVEDIERLKDLLARHVIRETESIYTWASADQNHVLARSMLRRVGRPLPKGPDDAVVATLVHLVAACHDGERGYRHAARATKDEGYRIIFERYAHQRGSFAVALAGPLKRFGMDAEQAGTLLGAVHREWLDASAALTGGDPRTVLRECERGEAAAMKVYDEALHAGLPPDVQELVQEQHDLLRKAGDEMRSLLSMEKH